CLPCGAAIERPVHAPLRSPYINLGGISWVYRQGSHPSTHRDGRPHSLPVGNRSRSERDPIRTGGGGDSGTSIRKGYRKSLFLTFHKAYSARACIGIEGLAPFETPQPQDVLFSHPKIVGVIRLAQVCQDL